MLVYCFVARITVYDDKFVEYSLKKRTFMYDSIESIKVDQFGAIILKYNNKTYKLKGVLSLITQDPSEKKNQEIVDLINEKANRKYKTDVLLDDENNGNLF